MNAQPAAPGAPRVCPRCGHRSHPSETGNHNCVSVLRNHLHEQKRQLLELRSVLAAQQIELESVRDMVGAKDLRVGLLGLLRERDALRLQVPEAYGRGLLFGQRLARVALRQLACWPLRRREGLRQAQALLDQVEDRKVSG